MEIFSLENKIFIFIFVSNNNDCMKKIIAFAGSNSKNSINKQLVEYVSSLIEDYEVEVLDLNNFELPIYGIDYENENGIPEAAHQFLEKIKKADGVILSLAEHNGAYATVFKNIFDWMSRIESKTFFGNPMLLMATSPGGRGGKSVLEIAQDRFPRHDAEIVEVFSLPFFKDNFSNGTLINSELDSELKEKLDNFKEAL
jgi:NAD(P)H-dependent FMN reductase